ncbi:MAG: twitching motility protein PilT [Acidobacteria bacterium RIFCSPLOWO2_12_FULL_60_22]|nr:MAG: twitching motility protein PilT [Acidobacteria bacterium RIFCSPLOWO2_12_FULL_60_22]
MEFVVDTSVLIAVLTSEAERAVLVERTRGVHLVAPASVHWEVGNAFAAMLKRRRITLPEIEQALEAYGKIPLRLMAVDLTTALQLAAEHNLYAYDAYVLACATRQRCPLLTLDGGLARAARAAGVQLGEISQ